MTEGLQLVQLHQLNQLNKEDILTILHLIHHRLPIVQLDSKMTLKLLSNHQTLVFINSKRVYQNLSQLVTKRKRMRIEIFPQNLEVGLRFQGLLLRAKVVRTGETKICLKINKSITMKKLLKSKERSSKMAKRSKNIMKASQYEKRSFEHLLKRRKGYIKVIITTLTCNSSTLKKAVSANHLFLDHEAQPTPAPTSRQATAPSKQLCSTNHQQL